MSTSISKNNIVIIITIIITMLLLIRGFHLAVITVLDMKRWLCSSDKLLKDLLPFSRASAQKV